MLESNLTRLGKDLSIESDLLYVDVNNRRIGVNSTIPAGSLQVDSIVVDDNTIRSQSGIVDLGELSSIQINGGDPDAVIMTDSTGVLRWSTLGEYFGDLSVNGQTISSDISGASLTLGPTVTLSPAAAGFVTLDASTGVVMPIGSTAERPNNAPVGTTRYNTSYDAIEVFDGANWVKVGDPDTSVVSVDSFVGDGTKTTFVMSGIATTNQVIVTINGLVQHPVESYTASGTTLEFVQAPALGDEISVRRFTATHSNRSLSDDAGSTYIVVDEVYNDRTIRMYADFSEKVNVTSEGIAVLPNPADPSVNSNLAFLYSKDDLGTTSMYVQDGAGNSTKISPHNNSGDWEYYSVNKQTGKVVKINMEKMILRLEEVLGETFFEEYSPGRDSK
jgi:hypothetical protein